MYTTTHYKIDFEKVKTTEDVIRILKALDVCFEHTADLSGIDDLIKEVPRGPLVATMD